MTVLRISHPPRQVDDWGNGAFAASRGGRYHLGRDYLYEPGEEVRTPMEATVLRLGYPYNDSESENRYRLIEMLSFNVETGARLIWRFFYVRPFVAVGEVMMPAEVIGEAQDISSKYVREGRRPMGNHVHVECIMDPETFFESVNRGRRQLWV